MKNLKNSTPLKSKALFLALAGILMFSSCKKDTSIETPDALIETESVNAAAATWRLANLTNFESYPDPGSEECVKYNGCTWSGQFAFVNGTQALTWVKANNIISIHSKDAGKYKLKTLRLRKNGKTIDAKVYDNCADSDCDGCCTINANQGGIGFLVDIEKFTMQRFGYGDGTVEWQCLDCPT